MNSYTYDYNAINSYDYDTAAAGLVGGLAIVYMIFVILSFSCV